MFQEVPGILTSADSDALACFRSHYNQNAHQLITPNNRGRECKFVGWIFDKRRPHIGQIGWYPQPPQGITDSNSSCTILDEDKRRVGQINEIMKYLQNDILIIIIWVV